MLPRTLHAQLETVIGSTITDTRSVGGGCISNAARIRTSNGRDRFLKWGGREEFARGIFFCEAEALTVLAEGKEIRVPAVFGVKDEEAEFSWLLLEWLEPGRASGKGWEALGRSLAALHRRQINEFGWVTSNFIGTLPQWNEWRADWPTFWREQRIEPQMRSFSGSDRGRIEGLLDHTADLLAIGNDEGPSLLHGDLWGGNVHGLEDGTCALIDPSAYYGHREVDLAMAALFGGFSDRFFDAYNEVWPLQPGFERRRHFYQLYYMLVHVNLFGASYLSGTRALLSKLGF